MSGFGRSYPIHLMFDTGDRVIVFVARHGYELVGSYGDREIGRKVSERKIINNGAYFVEYTIPHGRFPFTDERYLEHFTERTWPLLDILARMPDSMDEEWPIYSAINRVFDVFHDGEDFENYLGRHGITQKHTIRDIHIYCLSSNPLPEGVGSFRYENNKGVFGIMKTNGKVLAYYCPSFLENLAQEFLMLLQG